MHYMGMALQGGNPRSEGLIAEHTKSARVQTTSQPPELKMKEDISIEITQPFGEKALPFCESPQQERSCDLAHLVSARAQSSGD